MRAQIRSKYKTSPFMLQVSVTDRGVFFDQVDAHAGGKKLMIQTSPDRARRLAKWILDNVQAED